MDEYTKMRQAKLAELKAQEHRTADGYPIRVGEWYWSNDLKVVQVTEVVHSWNEYQGDLAVQVWHETLDLDGRRGSFDSLVGELYYIGRLAAFWEGMPAEVNRVPQVLAPRDCGCQPRRHTHNAR